MTQDVELIEFWDFEQRNPALRGGYEGALVAAGCTVHYFDLFGDYQGTWLALVTFQGTQGIVVGSYGSCSGCDAWEGWRDDHFGQKSEADWRGLLAAFGDEYLPPKPLRPYLDDLRARITSWADHDDLAMLAWIEGVLAEFDPELAMELAL